MIRPEHEPKINEMIVALRLSRGRACILLVACNNELLRKDVEAEIRRRLEPEGFNFREFRATEDGYKNVPIMLVNMKPQPGDIFLVFDLKKALPEVLEYLNYRREDFVEHNISAIFWLDDPTLTEIARKAPDFWAFRSLPAFEFETDEGMQKMEIPGRTTPSEIFIYDNVEELNAKISLREEMLSDYLEKRPEDRSTIASLHNELGVLYCAQSMLDEAMAHYEESLALSREISDKKGEAIALGNMGIVYEDKGNLDKALEYHSQALEIDRRIGNVQGEAIRLGNMGSVHYQKGDLDKALEYHSQALEIDRRIGDVKGEASDLGNMGNVYRNMDDLDKALEYYSQALEIDRRIGNVQGEARHLGNMGIVYANRGDLDKALEYYSQALEIDRRIGNVQGEARHLGNMGIVYANRGDLDKALEYTKNALRIFVSIGVPISADIFFRNLQKIAEQMKTAGMELSEEVEKEIDELIEKYREMKGKAADDAGGSRQEAI